MTLFFFVVGLEARREFDMGELRERRRLALPLAAGIGGMLVPVAIYLAVNAGELVGARLGRRDVDRHGVRARHARAGRPALPDRLRAFLLTVVVVDDVVALGVIGVVYSEDVAVPALLIAIAIFAVIVVVRSAGLQRWDSAGAPSTPCWGPRPGSRCYESGVEPVVVGLAMGLLAYAYPAARGDLERATDLFRLFREQPTPELARAARLRAGVGDLPQRAAAAGCSTRGRATSIVPLFALANAGIAIDAELPRRRLHLADHPRDPARLRGRQAASGSSAPPGW